MIEVGVRQIEGVYYYFDKVTREVFMEPRIDKGLSFRITGRTLVERQPFFNLLDIVVDFDEELQAYKVEYAGYTRRVKSFKSLFRSVATAITSCWKDAVAVSTVGWNPETQTEDWEKKRRLQNAVRYEVKYGSRLRGTVEVWVEHRGAFYLWVGARPHKGHFVPRCRAVELGCIPFFDKRSGWHPGINPDKIGIRPYVESNLGEYIERHIFGWLQATLGYYLAGLIAGVVEEACQPRPHAFAMATGKIGEYTISLSEVERELRKYGAPIQEEVKRLREKLQRAGLDMILHEQVFRGIRRVIERLGWDIREVKEEALMKALSAAGLGPDQVVQTAVEVFLKMRPVLHEVEEFYVMMDPYVEARKVADEYFKRTLSLSQAFRRLKDTPEWAVKMAFSDQVREVNKFARAFDLDWQLGRFEQKSLKDPLRAGDQLKERLDKQTKPHRKRRS